MFKCITCGHYGLHICADGSWKTPLKCRDMFMKLNSRVQSKDYEIDEEFNRIPPRPRLNNSVQSRTLREILESHSPDEVVRFDEQLVNRSSTRTIREDIDRLVETQENWQNIVFDENRVVRPETVTSFNPFEEPITSNRITDNTTTW